MKKETNITETTQPERNPFGLITNAEFCKIMKISKKTAFRWRAKGLLPYLSIQKQIYYKESEVRKALAQYSFRNDPKKNRS